MEEVTGYVFRNTLNSQFGFVDKYFTPFVTPNQNKILKTRDGRELLPEHNEGLNVVIQVFTNDVDHFIQFASYIYELGYKEINLNFGCPSNTVVKKRKGSGILKDLFLMDKFLDGIFNGISCDIKISVKTRIGILDADEIDDILKIYNRYPLSELIVHPRIQKQFYDGKPDLESFSYFYENAKMPLCYNGDIFSLDDFKNIMDKYPKLSSVMIGRGAVIDPGIFTYIKNDLHETADINTLRSFHDSLLELYNQEFGVNDSMFKMKEFWSYFIRNNHFDIHKLKLINKSKNTYEYNAAVNSIFNQ